MKPLAGCLELQKQKRPTVVDCGTHPVSSNYNTCFKMPLKITIKENYILIESSAGMVYWDIIEGILKLFAMPEFRNKNDIWLFKNGQLKMMYSDLHNIKDMAEKLYPDGSKGTKTAIVTQTAVQHSLAALYSDLAEGLPRKVKVFPDLRSAKAWICI